MNRKSDDESDINRVADDRVTCVFSCFVNYIKLVKFDRPAITKKKKTERSRCNVREMDRGEDVLGVISDAILLFILTMY